MAVALEIAINKRDQSLLVVHEASHHWYVPDDWSARFPGVIDSFLKRQQFFGARAFTMLRRENSGINDTAVLQGDPGMGMDWLSHARACADLVLAAVMRGLSPDFVTLDDWMPREIDKQAVHCLIDRALPRLDATQAEAVKAWQSRQ